MTGSPRTRSGRPSPLLVGAVASGAGIYVFQVVAARSLTEADYAPLAVLWTLQYLVFAVVLHPGETYVARETLRHGTRSQESRDAAGAVLALAAALSVLAGSLGAAMADGLLGSDEALAVVAALIVLAYGGFVVVRGRLLGEGRERAYAWATGVDAVLRLCLLLVLVVAGVGDTTSVVAWTLPSGALVVVGWYVLQPHRGGEGRLRRLRSSLSSFRFLGGAALAALAAQTLLAGAPVLMAAAGAARRDVSACFVVFSLARAPLVLGFGGLAARVVPMVLRLQDQADGPWRQSPLRAALVRLVGTTALLTAAAAALGGLAGPASIAAVFGAELAPSSPTVALVAAGSVLAGSALLLTQAGTVLGLERLAVLPWMAGLGAAGGLCVTLGVHDVLGVASAFAAGELVALAGFVILAGSCHRGPSGRAVVPSAARTERTAP